VDNFRAALIQITCLYDVYKILLQLLVECVYGASHGPSWAFYFFLGISSGWNFFETSEKIWGHVAGEGEFENRG